MFERVKKMMLCPRGVNAVFVVVCVAGAFGVPNVAVMLVSAGLYAMLVWLG